MFDYRIWLAPYLAIVLLICCCLVTTCIAQRYSSHDNQKNGEIVLKESEKKKIRRRKRSPSPYGATNIIDSSYPYGATKITDSVGNLSTSETQTSLPNGGTHSKFIGEPQTDHEEARDLPETEEFHSKKTLDEGDIQCKDKTNEIVNDNANQLEEDNDNSLKTKEMQLQKTDTNFDKEIKDSETIETVNDTVNQLEEENSNSLHDANYDKEIKDSPELKPKKSDNNNQCANVTGAITEVLDKEESFEAIATIASADDGNIEDTSANATIQNIFCEDSEDNSVVEGDNMKRNM